MFQAVRIVHPLFVFVLTFIVYALTMPRAITLEDAGLFQMVCHLDGIGHPPGYPLFTLLCQPLTWSPHVVNGNLLSATFASMTTALFYYVCFRLMGDRAFAYVAALAYGFSAAFWSQAIIIEVYTLATLMFVICWWLVLEFVESKRLSWWFAFCLAYGLSLSNHWPLMVLSTPGLLVMLWPVRAFLFEQVRRLTFWSASLALLVLGLAPYVTLVTNNDPAVALYGSIDSLKEFIAYVTRTYYRDNHPTADVYDKLQYGLWILKASASQFGWLGFPVLVTGIAFSFKFVSRNLNLALLLIYLGTTFVLLMLLNFEYREISRAVFKPYPVIAYMAPAFWFAIGATAIGRWVGNHASWGPSAIVVVCIAVALFSNLGNNNRSEAELVSRHGKTILNSLPRDAVLFVRADNQTGVIGYLHHVKKIRPDIELRQWHSLVFDNRLISPYADTRELSEAAKQYINETDKAVFSINPLFTSSINFGAYHQAALADGYGFVPGLDEYLDYLLTLYRGGYIHDAHEQLFAYDLLLAYARQYVGYALSVGEDNMADVRQIRMQRLQLTFPGRLATLEKMLEEAPDRQRLVDIAQAAESDMPKSLSPGTRATFYHLYGRVLTLDPAEPDKALHYFRRSLDLYPMPDNSSICPMIRLYKRSGNEEAISSLRDRFPGAEC